MAARIAVANLSRRHRQCYRDRHWQECGGSYGRAWIDNYIGTLREEKADTMSTTEGVYLDNVGVGNGG